MSYEKPELFVLNGAARAVLTRDSSEGTDTHHPAGKGASVAESNDVGTNDTSINTSSTGSAYEADE